MASEPNNSSRVFTPPPASMDKEHDDGLETPSSIHEETKIPEFKPSARIYLAFLTLCVITLMVALDGTSLSVAIPVSSYDADSLKQRTQDLTQPKYRSSQTNLKAQRSRPSGPGPPSSFVLPSFNRISPPSLTSSAGSQ